MHRTNANRLGVAVQLCFLRHPGRAWAPEETMPAAMLRFIAQQVGAEPHPERSLEDRRCGSWRHESPTHTASSGCRRI